MADNLNIVNNTEKKRFEAQLDGDDLALIEYSIAGKNILYTHTEVPSEYEGQGIATQLAHAVMEYAKNEGFKVQALCPFVNKYVSENPEYHDITWGYFNR